MSDTADLRPRDDQIFIGGDSAAFDQIGRRWLRYFVEECDLQPHEDVLDVGSGIGRVAVPLAEYLSADARYEGLDPVEEGITWCRTNITPRYPNFHFELVDVFNSTYNPNGSVMARDYVFPFEDEDFDFAVATSVFTHMLPEDMEHYFSEIRRVLRRGERWLASFFLWNDEALRRMKARKSLLRRGKRRLWSFFLFYDEAGHRYEFEHDLGNYRIGIPDEPESKVAYQEEYVLDLYRRSGFEIVKPIDYGLWRESVSKTEKEDQDIIVAVRL